MNIVFLLLGSNLEHRPSMLKHALDAIGEEIGKITRVSSVYETEPWGFISGNHFLNQAVRVETPCSSEEVLLRILRIEERLGRVRINNGYQSRTIDIDILLFNDEIIDRDALRVPHPKIPYRRFVLFPLSEIAPDQVHPEYQKTIGLLLDECPDTLAVVPFHEE